MRCRGGGWLRHRCGSRSRCNRRGSRSGHHGRRFLPFTQFAPDRLAGPLDDCRISRRRQLHGDGCGLNGRRRGGSGSDRSRLGRDGSRSRRCRRRGRGRDHRGGLLPFTQLAADRLARAFDGCRIARSRRLDGDGCGLNGRRRGGSGSDRSRFGRGGSGSRRRRRSGLGGSRRLRLVHFLPQCSPGFGLRFGVVAMDVKRPGQHSEKSRADNQRCF